jgi:sn-glycerol 3-phosphate transport system permease protein
VGFLGLTKKFAGVSNYTSLFADPYYQRIFLNTAVFASATVFFSMLFGLSLAMLANQKVTGWRVYRLLLIWPYALPPAVGGVIILFMVNSQAGIANYLLEHFMGIRPNWLTNPSLAMSVVVMAAVWKNIGYNVVFYLAALQNLPGEVLEAALIDGATIWQRFWKITFPLLSPMTLFLLVINTIYAFFDTFPFIDLLTKGGPAEATTVLIYSIYRDGFQYFKTGFAAAQSVTLFVVVVGLTILQFRFSGKMVHYGG